MSASPRRVKGPAAATNWADDDDRNDQQEMDQSAGGVELAVPSAHSTRRITAIVHSMVASLSVSTLLQGP